MQNKSGINPVEFNVLVLPDEVKNKTEGGLMLPDSTVDRNKHSATHGVIVACSPLAFNADIHPEDLPKPQPGQRVVLAQHSGTFVKGKDGVEYRLIKDKDVVATME
jgi:co-chaperonin GroES (HSP10)